MLLQKWQTWTARAFRMDSWVMATYAACGQQLLKDLSGLSVIAADLWYESLSDLMVLRRRDTEEEWITGSQKYTGSLWKHHTIWFNCTAYCLSDAGCDAETRLYIKYSWHICDNKQCLIRCDLNALFMWPLRKDCH